MIRVDKIIPGGEAIGTADNGKKIFFWNALPEEMIQEYKTTKIKSNFEKAVALKIINPSNHRVNPKDTCFLSTSPWQIMDYDYELSTKQDLVVEIFREHQIKLDKPEIITDKNPYFYRNKMEYSLYWDNDTSKILLSFHARGTHNKVPIATSSIERPEIFSAAKQIIEELNSRGEEARKYQSLLLRCNQNGQISGGLFENKKPHPTFKNLTDKILGYEYSYSPNGFFQINLPVYELALKEIKKYITTDKVLDLYAGVGTIGLSVARDKQLTLAECDKFAFTEMCNNITSGKILQSLENEVPESSIVSITKQVQYGNILAILTKSEDITDYITKDTTVILDPPRAGCDTKLINRLLEVRPPKIIYLSCNPATQARDIKPLLEYYKIEQTKIFNFFPRTPHIENLVVLSL